MAIFKQLFYMLMLSAMVLIISAPDCYAATNDLFTVEDVNIDITSENAVEAREKAFQAAQEKAFRILTERLVAQNSAAASNKIDTGVIDSLVQDFEITSEQVSDVRYVGTYVFRFKPAETQRFFEGSGQAYTNTQSKPVLILPFLSWGGQTILWGNGNPWLTAWNKKIYKNTLVPISVPIGDLEDIADIKDNQALTYNARNVNNLRQRYKARETMVVLATPQWPSQSSSKVQQQSPEGLTIMIYNADGKTPRLVNQLFVPSTFVTSRKNIYDIAVSETLKVLENDWKSLVGSSSGQTNIVQAYVSFRSMEQWVNTHKALQNVGAVRSVEIISLTPSFAKMNIQFSGSQDYLRTALAQANIDMTPSTDPYAYILTMHRYR